MFFILPKIEKFRQKFLKFKKKKKIKKKIFQNFKKKCIAISFHFYKYEFNNDF